MTSRLALLLLLLPALVIASGCRQLPPVLDLTDQPVALARTLTEEQVKNAIIKGGGARGWIIQEAGPGVLSGTVGMRGNLSATIEIRYDDKTYSITRKSSQGFRFKDGKIHPRYNGGIMKLNQEIKVQLNLAGR